jgi:hypothetical protein
MPIKLGLVRNLFLDEGNIRASAIPFPGLKGRPSGLKNAADLDHAKPSSMTCQYSSRFPVAREPP